jgi:Fe(3+) dicitrate transport protein
MLENFSRIPGVNIWENEGSGIQINVGVRGLSPNRSWELNTKRLRHFFRRFWISRSYYNPPMEAVETIELFVVAHLAVWPAVWWYELCT